MKTSISIAAWTVIFGIQLADARGVPAHARLQSFPLEEPLVATSTTSAAEDVALLRILQARHDPDDFTAVEAFLAEHPASGWRVALFTNLGLSYYHYGYFSRAIDSFQHAWTTGKSIREPRAKALVDRAVAELARMHARLGHADKLEALLREIGDRHVTGSATELLQGARDGLWLMHNDPGKAFLCGPFALKNLLLAQGVPYERVKFLEAARSSRRGVSLAEVASLAAQAKIPNTLVFREAHQPIPVPSIVHWKATHFAAIVEESENRFHIQDPTFGPDLWVTRRALESEASGYFLVPGDTSAGGWRTVSAAEAGDVRGMGATDLWEAIFGKDFSIFPDNPACHGMCGYNILQPTVSLVLKDNPVGYAPPKGPAASVTITYNQRESDQPANFNWFNVSAKWTLNWLTYIQDDPTNARANALRYAAGGGSVTYLGFNTSTNSYTRETRDASLLVRTATSPIAYERRLADGGKEIYSQSNGATTNPRRVFLTQIVDPAGNALTLSYDSQLRLTALTDATRRVTKFAYEQPGKPLLVTTITDPFGRSAKLSYDSAGRLSQITDVYGLTSQFTYDSSNLVNSMTTPYGATKFVSAEGYNPFAFMNFRSLEVTDPLGHQEKLEYRHQAATILNGDPENVVPKGMLNLVDDYLWYRDTYYWDKHSYVTPALGLAPYRKARAKHWTHVSTNENMVSHVVESYKEPYENRVWLTYPGQKLGFYTGSLDRTNALGRVLDDGSTQLIIKEYNALGHETRIVDAAGRETQFDYDPTGTDLARVRQKTASGFATLAEFTYNSRHMPLTFKNAAGETTTYVYNSAGQPAQMTDALGNVTKYEYDSLGYLTRIVNANGQTAASLTYDSFGRVATRTDSEGYTVSFTYDALDRTTKIGYPDGSTREYTWDKLDLVAVKDRLGRTTNYTYDAARNLTSMTDPLGRQTTFDYYENGFLKSVTDPNGNTTSWDIDFQNRVTAKHFPDGTQTTYTYENTTSRLKSVTDAVGQTKQYTYTHDGLLAGVSYTGAANPTPSVQFTYDPYFQRMVSMKDAAGTTQYRYNDPGSPGALRVALINSPAGDIAYQYDALGRIRARTVDGAVESFEYDSLGRVKSHAGALGTVDMDYLGQTLQITGRRVRDTSLGTTFAYGSNVSDRQLATVNNGGARGYQYMGTPENMIARIAEIAADSNPWPAQTWSYSYDDAGGLLQATGSGGAQFAYQYDTSGNIMAQQRPDGFFTSSYDAANRIAAVNGQAFTYDANGNLMDDGRRTYTWDAENRLLSVATKAQPDKTTSLRYDGFGRRIATVSPDGVETQYLWCGEALCAAKSGGAVTRRYYAEGELAGDRKLYYARDHLGSVRDVLSVDDGSRIASFDYDPYGNPMQIDGSLTTDFRYAGMFYEPTSGLYLTRFRAYDPRTGRWLSRDPLGNAGGTNLYAYVNGNPITNVDPFGLETCPCNNTTQYSISAGASFYALIGFDVNLGIGISIPDNHNWRDIQLFVNAQGNRGAGPGAYLGAGFSAGESRGQVIPVNPGSLGWDVQHGTFAEGQAGAGVSGGLSWQYDPCLQFSGWGGSGGKAGFGLGASVDFGTTDSVTISTPKLGDIFDSAAAAWQAVDNFFTLSPSTKEDLKGYLIYPAF